MKRVICKQGQIKSGTTTVTLERRVILFIRNVPAEICDTCGEKYCSVATITVLRNELEAAEKAGQEFQVRSFAA